MTPTKKMRNSRFGAMKQTAIPIAESNAPQQPQIFVPNLVTSSPVNKPTNLIKSNVYIPVSSI